MNKYPDTLGERPDWDSKEPSASAGSSSMFPSPVMKHYTAVETDWGAFGRYVSGKLREMFASRDMK